MAERKNQEAPTSLEEGAPPEPTDADNVLAGVNPAVIAALREKIKAELAGEEGYRQPTDDEIDAAAEKAIEGLRSATGRPPRPGTILNAGTPHQSKVRWTERDIRREYPGITWTPMESLPITYGELTIQVTAGEETTTPSIFKDIHDQRQQELRNPMAKARSYGFQTVDYDGIGSVRDEEGAAVE